MDLNEKELQTIRDTIDHWEKDIREKLLQGERINCGPRGQLRWADGSPVKCFAQHSALCRMFVTTDRDIYCDRCPYCRYHGISCNERTSAWFEFVNEPTLDACNRMIDSLKDLLVHKEEPGGNKKENWREFRIGLKSGAVFINLN